MLNIAAQSIANKAPQQAARIQKAIRSITSDSFAFYPVRKNRYDQIVPTSMFQASTQTVKKAPQQQAARISTATRTTKSYSFAFYPAEKNRVRMVTPKTSRNCYGFYPANVSVLQETRKQATTSIKDIKAVRAALMQKKQGKKASKEKWESLMQEMRAIKKTTATRP